MLPVRRNAYKNDADEYAEKVIAKLDEAKNRQTCTGEYIINVTMDIENRGWLIAGDEYNGKRITIKSDNEAETRNFSGNQARARAEARQRVRRGKSQTCGASLTPVNKLKIIVHRLRAKVRRIFTD
ncbi:MAG: hypothetical protein LBF75_02040 [Treponema sp.]|nr:hypothetical protein [Treponema sp.]